MGAHDSPRRKSKAVGSGFELYICAFDKAWNDGGLEDIIKLTTDARISRKLTYCASTII